MADTKAIARGLFRGAKACARMALRPRIWRTTRTRYLDRARGILRLALEWRDADPSSWADVISEAEATVPITKIGREAARKIRAKYSQSADPGVDHG